MSVLISSTLPIIQEFTANLAQAASTYTLATAVGSLVIDKMSFYVTTAGATFTSVTFQTNATTPFVFLTAADGATSLSNLAVQKNLATTWIQNVPVAIKNGQLITYTITGLTGTGSLNVTITYRPSSVGAVLT
jgi:hypothetical protein